ncbi:hypothetical protein ScPMuIL_006964 [Solemya velum]
MKNHIMFAVTVAASAMLVYSDPIIPELDIAKYDVADACLFICNLCFDTTEKEMLQCANDICLNGKIPLPYGFLWLGKTCANFDKMAKYVFPNAKH